MAPWPTGWLLTTLAGLALTLGWCLQPVWAQSATGNFETRTVTRQAPAANNLPGPRAPLPTTTGHLATSGEGSANSPAHVPSPAGTRGGSSLEPGGHRVTVGGPPRSRTRRETAGPVAAGPERAVGQPAAGPTAAPPGSSAAPLVQPMSAALPDAPPQPGPGGASRGVRSRVAEVPGGDWIISSREVKGSPATHDCAGQMEYLYRGSEGLVQYSAQEFLSSLRPDRPVCVVIHGSYNYWRDVLAESDRNRVWIQQAAAGGEVQIVHFSWPSDGVAHVLFPVELRVMGRRAAVHGGYLAQLISLFPADQPVTLVGHSHGARCVAATLHALGGGVLDDGSHLGGEVRSPQRVRGVLLAAAIDHNWLNPGERYDRAVTVVEGILVLTNPRDGWLQVYPLHTPLKGTQALGLEGLTRRDVRSLGGWGDRVQTFDCSDWVGRSHDFATINSQPGLASVLQPYVVFAPQRR
ncbi:MAG: hypothetical protein ACK5TO_08150 [Planctomycetaceae bacterium]